MLVPVLVSLTPGGGQAVPRGAGIGRLFVERNIARRNALVTMPNIGSAAAPSAISHILAGTNTDILELTDEEIVALLSSL
jgi:hypothetical protein